MVRKRTLPRISEKKAAAKSRVPRLPSREGAVGEQLRLDDRARVAAAAQRPRRRAAAPAAAKAASVAGGGPAPVVALDDPQRHRGQPEGQHQRPGQVRAGGCRRPAARAAGGGRRTAIASAERQVDEEDEAPVGELDQRRRRGVGPTAAAAAAAAPQSPTPAARCSTGKLSRTIASEVGAIIAAPTPCRTRKAISASSDGRDRAEQAGGGEAGDAEQEDPLVAEAVGEAAGRHQQRRDHDEVAVEHPGEQRRGSPPGRRPRCRGRRC